jgi:hypothetical protein
MRKEEIRGLIIYAIMIVVALVVGLTVISKEMTTASLKMSDLLFLVIVIVVAYLFNAIWLELMHILGAKMGGYKVTSVNILWLCIYNDGKTWRFGLKDFNGVCGETRVAPKKEKTNANLLNWLPLFGFAAELAACVVVKILVKSSTSDGVSWLGPASMVFLLISALIAFYNFVPLKLDTLTDGYRIRLFTKPVNIDAYNQMLVIQDKQRLGEKVGKIPVFSEITEYTAEINTAAMYKLLEEEKYEEAIEIIDHLLEKKKVINVADSNRLIAQKLYATTFIQERLEVKKLYEEICPIEIRRFIANDVSLQTIRAYIIIAGMIEESESEVAYAKAKIEKARKKASASVVKTEEKLLDKALKTVYEAHPKWVKENAAE